MADDGAHCAMTKQGLKSDNRFTWGIEMTCKACDDAVII